MFGFKNRNKKEIGSFSPVTKKCAVCGSSFDLTSIELRFYSASGVELQKCRACRQQSPFDRFEETSPSLVANQPK